MAIVDTSLKALEDLIQEQQSLYLNTESLAISCGEIIYLYSDQELKFREFNSLMRWDLTQRTLFLESIWLGLPMSPLVCVSHQAGTWELIDGLQRVVTILSFFGQLREQDLRAVTIPTASMLPNPQSPQAPPLVQQSSLENSWKLSAGSRLSLLEGFKVQDLSTKLYFHLKRGRIPITLIHADRSDNVSLKFKQDLFWRCNSSLLKDTHPSNPA